MSLDALTILPAMPEFLLTLQASHQDVKADFLLAFLYVVREQG